MDLMTRIYGRQVGKPEAMYSTHMQDAKNDEQDERQLMDKSVPATQGGDANDANITHTSDAHLQPQIISL